MRALNSQIRIGTAGFSYADWVGNFYPQFCKQTSYLKTYTTKFASVELDVTFYRIPTDKMIERWSATVPDGFTLSAKFPRMVTHEGDLGSRLEQAEYFVSVMRGLGEKLGALLLQFPYAFKPDSLSTLKALFELIPRDLQLAVEFRHKGWLTDSTFDLLRSQSAALCLVDHVWMPRLKLKTADFSYFYGWAIIGRLRTTTASSG